MVSKTIFYIYFFMYIKGTTTVVVVVIKLLEFNRRCWTEEMWKKSLAKPIGGLLISLLVFFRRSSAQSFVKSIFRRNLEFFSNFLVRLHFLMQVNFWFCICAWDVLIYILLALFYFYLPCIWNKKKIVIISLADIQIATFPEKLRFKIGLRYN